MEEDEGDYSEFDDETIDDDNGGSQSNRSDSRLTQYMMINKELSKTMVVLKAENAKLRNNNKELNMENLTYRNELTKNRNEIMKWRRKFAQLQGMHIHHVETLTGELQSFADKLTCVFGNEDGETESISKATEERLTSGNSPSITDDVLQPVTTGNSTAISDDVSPRISKSLGSAKPNTKELDMLDENPSNLNTINEESEGDIDTSNLEQISLITSTHESSTLMGEVKSMVSDPDVSKTIVFQRSVSDSCEMASFNSNKENERPSTFVSSNRSLPIEDSPSIALANEIAVLSIKKSITPLKETFITQRRTRKRTIEQNSFDGTDTPELISSTPFKRKRSATYSEIELKSSPPVKSSDTPRRSRRSVSMSVSASGRPKRSVCPVSFVEPKLNTKMRRPRK